MSFIFIFAFIEIEILSELNWNCSCVNIEYDQIHETQVNNNPD